MLYTRRGDDGTSGLFDTRERFSKDSLVYHALGTLDELNSLLGICRARIVEIKSELDAPGEILKAQERLFIIQAELAGARKSILPVHVSELEGVIAELENKIANPHAFIIPGATALSALCDYARAVSRRTERVVISLHQTRAVSPLTLAYLNRLSSFLYALARYAAKEAHSAELLPSYADGRAGGGASRSGAML